MPRRQRVSWRQGLPRRSRETKSRGVGVVSLRCRVLFFLHHCLLCPQSRCRSSQERGQTPRCPEEGCIGRGVSPTTVSPSPALVRRQIADALPTGEKIRYFCGNCWERREQVRRYRRCFTPESQQPHSNSHTPD